MKAWKPMLGWENLTLQGENAATSAVTDTSSSLKFAYTV
jgi:hypothetical protein